MIGLFILQIDLNFWNKEIIEVLILETNRFKNWFYIKLDWSQKAIYIFLLYFWKIIMRKMSLKLECGSSKQNLFI